MRQLINFFHYLIILPRIKVRLVRINNVLKTLKREVCKNPNWASIISSKGFDLRLTQYVQVHSLLDFSLCGLSGRKISKYELEACVYFCACLPLYDDFFDKTDLSEKEIRELMTAPEDFKSENSVQELFIFLLKIVYRNLPDSDLFSRYFEQLYFGQKESKRLLNPELSRADVKLIAFQKGGFSALLFRSILNHPLIHNEEKAIYQLGAVGQFLDDLFDLWDDLEEGINTIVTKFDNDFSPIFSQYIEEVEKLKSNIQELNYEKKNKNKFIRELMLMVNGGTICGKHYLRLQSQNNGVFDIQKIGRKAMICDMEKVSSKFKMIKQSILNA